MSWAAHEFENYFLQRHTGAKAAFLAIVVGTSAPDLFTKAFAYGADDPARFHRGWPGVGFSHSLIFGVGFAGVVLALTRSRNWALGILIGQWAHVLADIGDTAGVMPFFPFSTEPVSIGMWKHAAVLGQYGDAAAYYSSLGGVWDAVWLVMLIVLGRRTLRRDYFRTVVVPADVRTWTWLHRHCKLGEEGLLLLYRGIAFYGLGRMLAWFVYARVDARTPLELVWGGPRYVIGNDLSDAGWVEVVIRTGLGAVLFTVFLWTCWRVFGRRLWERGEDPPTVQRAH